jgi:hypothetical protein
MSASHKHPACAKGSDLNNRFDYREFGNPLSITTRLAFDFGHRIFPLSRAAPKPHLPRLLAVGFLDRRHDVQVLPPFLAS